MLLVVLSIDRQTGHLVAGPDLISRGFLYEGEEYRVTEEARELVRRTFQHDGGHTV
jgi:ribonuclease J